MLVREVAVIAGLLLVSSVGCSGSDDSDEGTSNDAIVGVATANGERPEVVRIAIHEANGEEATCTGTLIGARTVLTARHCLADLGPIEKICPVEVLVDRAGRGTTRADVERIPATRCDVLVPDARNFWTRDLATIRLARPVVGVTPAKLADDVPEGDVFTAYGYGSFGAPVTFATSCSTRSDGNKRKKTYTGSVAIRFGRVTCAGDSGGPHFAGTSNVVAAVTSGGFDAGIGVEANALVWQNVDWIRERVRAYETP